MAPKQQNDKPMLQKAQSHIVLRPSRLAPDNNYRASQEQPPPRTPRWRGPRTPYRGRGTCEQRRSFATGRNNDGPEPGPDSCAAGGSAPADQVNESDWRFSQTKPEYSCDVRPGEISTRLFQSDRQLPGHNPDIFVLSVCEVPTGPDPATLPNGFDIFSWIQRDSSSDKAEPGTRLAVTEEVSTSAGRRDSRAQTASDLERLHGGVVFEVLVNETSAAWIGWLPQHRHDEPISIDAGSVASLDANDSFSPKFAGIPQHNDVFAGRCSRICHSVPPTTPAVDSNGQVSRLVCPPLPAVEDVTDDKTKDEDVASRGTIDQEPVIEDVHKLIAKSNGRRPVQHVFTSFQKPTKLQLPLKGHTPPPQVSHVNAKDIFTSAASTASTFVDVPASIAYSPALMSLLAVFKLDPRYRRKIREFMSNPLVRAVRQLEERVMRNGLFNDDYSPSIACMLRGFKWPDDDGSDGDRQTIAVSNDSDDEVSAKTPKFHRTNVESWSRSSSPIDTVFGANDDRSSAHRRALSGEALASGPESSVPCSPALPSGPAVVDRELCTSAQGLAWEPTSTLLPWVRDVTAALPKPPSPTRCFMMRGVGQSLGLRGAVISDRNREEDTQLHEASGDAGTTSAESGSGRQECEQRDKLNQADLARQRLFEAHRTAPQQVGGVEGQRAAEGDVTSVTAMQAPAKHAADDSDGSVSSVSQSSSVSSSGSSSGSSSSSGTWTSDHTPIKPFADECTHAGSCGCGMWNLLGLNGDELRLDDDVPGSNVEGAV